MPHTASRAAEQRVARLYAGFWNEIDTIRAPAIRAQFLSNVGLPEEWFRGRSCLEVGCGSGFAAWAMASAGARVCAVDLLPTSLATVRERLSAEREGVRLAAASAVRLPFASASFDFTHCNGVLHHTADPRRGFAELARVTRPGGTLFVSLYGKGGVYAALVAAARAVAPVVPYALAERVLDGVVGRRRIPNSFMPAKVSVLDNMYVPIRHSYREREVRRWFAEEGFDPKRVSRTRTTIYDHTRPINRLIHGDGYLQFRAEKPARG